MPRRENDPALGPEYERRISASFGVGALAEYTFSNHDTENSLRLGVEYAFKLSDGLGIAPQIDVDFVDD